MNKVMTDLPKTSSEGNAQTIPKTLRSTPRLKHRQIQTQANTRAKERGLADLAACSLIPYMLLANIARGLGTSTWLSRATVETPRRDATATSKRSMLFFLVFDMSVFVFIFNFTLILGFIGWCFVSVCAQL